MFDPFEKRLSRDIRNHLCNFFLEALEDGNKERLFSRAKDLKQKAPDEDHRDFVENRIKRYQDVFSALEIQEPEKQASSQGVDIAFHLWCRELFFECHEWLEGIWRKAQGEKKKALQGLIRCAGASVLWEAGRIGPAQSSAAKAMDLIREYERCLPPPFAPEHLVSGLERILEKKPEKE